MYRDFLKAKKDTIVKECKACGTVYPVSISDVRVRFYRKKAPSFSCKCPFCRTMNSIGSSKIPSDMIVKLYRLI